MDMMQIKLYTLEEVASILGVTHRTAWDYAKRNRIKAVKIGGRWKVTEENLRLFLNEETARA